MGEGRFTDVDVVRYDFVTGAPGPPAQAADRRPVIVFLRACDLHAVKRLDQMYLGNGPVDTFYARIRNRVRFALIGCTQSFASCFCVQMGANVAPEGWLFSLETSGDDFLCAVADESVKAAFAGAASAEKDVTPSHVTNNEVHVRTSSSVLASIYKDPLWDEYTNRCIRCDDVCSEYISFAACVNKLTDACEREEAQDE